MARPLGLVKVQLCPAMVMIWPAEGRMLNGFEVAPTPATEASSVYPLSALSMLRLLNVALPVASVVTARTPESVPAAGLLAMAIATTAPITGLLAASRTLTPIDGTAKLTPAPALLGRRVKYPGVPPCSVMS